MGSNTLEDGKDEEAQEGAVVAPAPKEGTEEVEATVNDASNKLRDMINGHPIGENDMD